MWSSSRPHQSTMENLLLRTTPVMVFRLRGQVATGPSFVFDQSIERMSAPISPPPARQSSSAEGVAGSSLPYAVVRLISHDFASHGAIRYRDEPEIQHQRSSRKMR